jgi:tetratricopeptide (TPR) repeat protein
LSAPPSQAKLPSPEPVATTPPSAPTVRPAAPSVAPAARTQPSTPKPPPSTPKPRAPAADDEGEGRTREAGWREASPEAIEQSIQQMLEGGRKGAAARIAWDAGQHERALVWFDELDMHFQAGSCLAALGRKDEALERMLREPDDTPRYRKVCFAIVDLAVELGRLDFDVDRYLNRFVDQGPTEVDEVPWYLRLAELYRRQGFERGAQRCFAKVLEIDAKNAIAREGLRAARAPARPSSSPAPQREGLPALVSLEDFAKLAREHAPKKAQPKS